MATYFLFILYNRRHNFGYANFFLYLRAVKKQVTIIHI